MGWMLWVLAICAFFVAIYANPEKSKELIETFYSKVIEALKESKSNKSSGGIVPHTSCDWHNTAWKKN